MSSQTPRKRLPVNPSIEHLKKQAKRRAKSDAALALSDAQHELAREYGCRNWAELAHVVETMSRGSTKLHHVKNEFEPLPEAANRNDMESVRRILSEGSFTQHDLNLALARSALGFNERRAIAELLTDHGADPDGQYGANYGPIIFAPCETLDPEGIQFLIDQGADVTFKPIDTKYGPASPLNSVLSTYHRGKNERRYRCIDILLKHGAYNNTPPLFLAILRGDRETIAAMIDQNPSLINERFDDMPFGNIALRGGTLLHMAIEYGEIEIAELLLVRGANINARSRIIEGIGGQTPIFHAIASPQPDFDLRPLEYIVNQNKNWVDFSITATFKRFGETYSTEPITVREFARKESAGKETAELRLLEGMNRPRVADPLFAQAVGAIEAGDVAKLRQVLAEQPELITARAEESGSFAGPYFQRPRLLWFIAENPTRTGKLPANIVEITQVILDAGALVEDITYTAMLVASGCVAREQGKQIALLELLVSRGADPSFALDAAVQESEKESIAALLRLGAKPNLPAAAGLGDLAALESHLQSSQPEEKSLNAAWYNAAVRGQVKAAELLVRLGKMPVNKRVAQSVTALHLAAWNDHPALVDRLLALGADPTIRDGRFNATPAQWAQHNKHPELAERLSAIESVQSRDSAGNADA